MPEAQQPAPALDHYATWRPRLARSATWAGTAAFLSKTMGGEARHIIPATIAAGAAGAADATLEDKIRRNKNLQEVHMRGYGKTAAAEDPRVASPEVVKRVEDGTNGVLGELFAHKNEIGAKARSQLGDLFPSSAKSESYGRVARLSPGGGALSAMLDSIRPVAR